MNKVNDQYEKHRGWRQYVEQTPPLSPLSYPPTCGCPCELKAQWGERDVTEGELMFRYKSTRSNKQQNYLKDGKIKENINEQKKQKSGVSFSTDFSVLAVLSDKRFSSSWMWCIWCQMFWSIGVTWCCCVFCIRKLYEIWKDVFDKG